MKDFDEIKDLLKVDGKVCDGKELSTFKGGGQAFVFMPKSVEEFVKTYSALKEEGKDIYVIGGGSNTIIKDGFCSRAIISTRELNKIFVDGDRVVCECGASVASVIKIAREYNFGGLEFLSGVPCSVGGAVCMNAGAFSSQTKDYIDEISILNSDCGDLAHFNSMIASGNYGDFKHVERVGINGGCEGLAHIGIVKINGNDREYSYRNGEKNIVLETTFKLRKMAREESVALSKKYVEERRKRQPNLPSVGSVFKNGKVASGKLIDECGLKGVRIGGAQISQKHANFIVNVGGGKACDFLALAELCKSRVFDKFGIMLEEEFEIVD